MVAVIYAPADLRVIAVCDGPDVTGRCPNVTGGEVPCSGLEITLSKGEFKQTPPGLRRPRLAVPASTMDCPLAGHNLTLASRRFCHDYFSPFAVKAHPEIGSRTARYARERGAQWLQRPLEPWECSPSVIGLIRGTSLGQGRECVRLL